MSVDGLVNPESEELGAFAFPSSGRWAREGVYIDPRPRPTNGR